MANVENERYQIMKYLLGLIFFVLLSVNLSAQGQEKYSLQLNYGISNTLHYNQPVLLNACVEGCFPEEQKPKLASNFDLSIYRELDKTNSLKIGVGFSQYRFSEKGLASPGGGSFTPYKTIIELGYFGISAGFRHIFTPTNKISPFVESEFIYEMLTEYSYFLKNHGIANKSQVAAIINLSKKWRGIVAGFYKTGIIRYDKKKTDKKYVPFGFGIQMGITLKI